MLGIDFDVVRARVEAVFGPGALDSPRVPPAPGKRRRWRSRTCQPAGNGSIPFTPRAKKVLELGLREALRLRHDWVGPEHLLMGLLREGEGLAAELLVSAGADLGPLRQDVLDRLRRVA